MDQTLAITHVVTRVSAGGASGGPTAVAHALIRQLATSGHRIKLFTGFDGKVDKPTGIDAEYFTTIHSTKHNFSSITSPLLFIRLAREAKRTDVAHIHLARDFVTLPAALFLLIKRVPIVIQTHGMIRPDNRFPARFLDAVFTKPIMRKCKVHLVLTPEEELQVREVEPRRSNIQMLNNGIEPSAFRCNWKNDMSEVLFCARLHSRKRASAFVEMARLLVEDGVKARFTIIGPDEGELPALKKMLAENDANGSIKYEGQIDPGNVINRISKAQVYVLPSREEPFPMTVLEAMSAGVPCVITDSNGIASTLSTVVAQSVCDGSPKQLADAVRYFLSDEKHWRVASVKSVELVETDFSLVSVASRLSAIYSGAK